MSILGVGENAIKVLSDRPLPQRNEVDILQLIPITCLEVGKYQPRRKSAIVSERLSDLVDSIKKNGVLQPLLVREADRGRYEIIAGERRYTASNIIGLSEIPCIIKNVSTLEAYALAIVENVQREELTQIEEAEALANLKSLHELSIEDLSRLIGKPRTTIANLIRVTLHASSKIKELCAEGYVDFGHLRAVLSLDHETQERLIQYVIDNDWSVRKTEDIVRTEGYSSIFNKEVLFKNLAKEELCISANKLKEHFSSPVKIKQISNGKIRVSIDFETMDALNNYLSFHDIG